MLSLFIIIISIYAQHVNGLKCFVEGKCIGINADTIEVFDTIDECIDKCQASNRCIYSTFNSYTNSCNIYHHVICSNINKRECPMCLTSEKDCTVSTFKNMYTRPLTWFKMYIFSKKMFLLGFLGVVLNT